MIIKYKRAAMCKGTLYDARAHICREAKKKKSSPSAYTLPFASGRRRGYGLIINHAVEMDWVLRSCQMRAADGRMVK